MAEIAKSGTPSLSSVNPPQSNQVGSGLVAGAAIGAGDACYIISGGKVHPATGAAANAAAKVRGWAAGPAALDEPVTLYFGVEFRYGAGLTPGASYFLSGTVAGGLADAASTGGTAPVAFAVDATRVRVSLSQY